MQVDSEISNSLIDNVVWNIGGIDTDTNTASNFYIAERGTIGCGANQSIITWTGKIGLMYPSDYGFAVGGNVKATCLATNLFDYKANNCMNNNWLYIDNKFQWTIMSYYPNANNACGVNYYGGISASSAIAVTVTRPVVYLKSSVKITGGTGSSSSPYTLSL